MNAVTAGFCRYGTYSIRHRLHRSVLYGGIDTVDSGVLIFIHRNDQTFLSVDDLGVNLSDFFRLDAQDDIVGLDGRDIFAIGISLRDRNGARGTATVPAQIVSSSRRSINQLLFCDFFTVFIILKSS